MDFELSDDQQALAAAMRSVLEGRFGLARVRGAEGQAVVASREDWAVLGDAGVFSLLLAESEGGTGLGLADAAVVYEELGRSLVPGPLVPSLLAAGWVKGAADGKVMVGVVELPEPGSSVPPMVEHLASLGAAVVLTPGAAPDSLRVVDHDGWAPVATMVTPLDPLSPLWRIEGPVPPGRHPGGTDPAGRFVRHARVLTVALQVGTAAACVELAVAYAGGRSQFGRPIGSFQAVKHICAEMLVRAELARAAVHAAALLCDQPDVARAEAEVNGLDTEALLLRTAAGAKLLADKAAITNARACIQVHGGMGFTWEVPVHLHLKRARARATCFGAPEALARAVGGLAGPGPR